MCVLGDAVMKLTDDQEKIREEFRSHIKQNPYDRGTRLIYADWLDEHDRPEESAIQRDWTKETYDEAKQWLTDFANKCGGSCTNYDEVWDDQVEEMWDPITYDDVVQAGYDYVNHGEYFLQVGTETARDMMYSPGTKELFWKHWQTVTDERVGEEKQGTVFSCTC